MASKSFRITPKGIAKGYRSECFEREAAEIQRTHFNDDFHLYVTPYAEYVDGVAHLLGITVCSDEDTIEWYAKRWINLGILEEIV